MRTGVSCVALERSRFQGRSIRPEDEITIVYCVYKQTKPRRLFYIVNGKPGGDYYEFGDCVISRATQQRYSIMHEISPYPTRALSGWVWQPRPIIEPILPPKRPY